jgi:hypothetical protein
LAWLTAYVTGAVVMAWSCYCRRREYGCRGRVAVADLALGIALWPIAMVVVLIRER